MELAALGAGNSVSIASGCPSWARMLAEAIALLAQVGTALEVAVLEVAVLGFNKAINSTVVCAAGLAWALAQADANKIIAANPPPNYCYVISIFLH